MKDTIVEEIPICTLDGYRYSLGPEYDGEANWHAAKQWCESLGEGYELPSRTLMRAICMNDATRTLLTDHKFYWTGTEDDIDISRAWVQHWYSGPPGFQYIAKKSLAFKVRAVRRSKVIDNEHQYHR